MRKFLTSRFPAAAKTYRMLRDSGVRPVLAIVATVLMVAIAMNPDLAVWEFLPILYA